MNKLLIVCGFPFAGKSSLAKALTERFGYAEVDVDTTEERLYGPGIKDENLSREQWNRIYAETDNK